MKFTIRKHTLCNISGVLLAFCALVSNSAFSQVNVQEAWVRATVPAQKVTGAFMQITSQQDKKLIRISSPVANNVELHEMKMQGDVMQMRPVETLDLPAGKLIELKPGSYHLMLMGLKAPVKEGDLIPITLTLENKDKKSETLEIKAKVRALNQMSK